MREQISSAIDVIVQVSRMSDGKRKIMAISEITGMEGNVVTMQDVFTYKRTGMGENGQVLGQFVSTGIRPRFIDRLKLSGVELPPNTFD
jgi:pilus assembly protein CpaF